MDYNSTCGRRLIIGGTLLALTSTACGKIIQNGLENGVRRYGALGNGLVNDAPAIQRAIDAAAEAGGGTVILEPGTYLLHFRPSEDGDGVTALTLRSNVTLEGIDRDQCILKLADKQMGPGTYARLIGSHGEITDASLRNFSIDGNRQGQGEFGKNISGGSILLGWKARCLNVTIEMLSIRDSVGQGIMIQGSIGNVSKNITVNKVIVERSAFIGIQCSQFDEIIITNNSVIDCHDNGIDIYGDDSKNNSTVSTSHRGNIAHNTVRGCSIGIFLETVADCIARNNIISDCRNAGIRINRIHGEPRNLAVEGNRISNTPTGIAISGDTGGVILRYNNIIKFSEAGIEFTYNVSKVMATNNDFYPAGTLVPIILGRPIYPNSSSAEQLSFIRILNNRILSPHDSGKMFVNGYRRMVAVDIDPGRPASE